MTLKLIDLSLFASGEENASLTQPAFDVIIEMALKFKTWAPEAPPHASQKRPCVYGWLFGRMGQVGGIMGYSKMRKAQLIEEIEALQGRIAELEHAQAERKRAEEALQELNAELEQRVVKRTAEYAKSSMPWPAVRCAWPN